MSMTTGIVRYSTRPFPPEKVVQVLYPLGQHPLRNHPLDHLSRSDICIQRRPAKILSQLRSVGEAVGRHRDAVQGAGRQEPLQAQVMTQQEILKDLSEPTLIVPHDYHVHTDFSCDCQASMSEMCRAAIERGIAEIGFSEHFDLNPEDPCHGFFEPGRWWDELEGCRHTFGSELAIRAGIELGEPHLYPGEMQELLDEYPWDYSLGSLHWVEGWLIFDRNYFRQAGVDPYRSYFRELARMAREAEFDILAHMDIVKRYGARYFGPLDPADYEAEIREVLRTCAARNIALEINTSTRRRGFEQASPSEAILRWFAEEGGRWITLASDAHFPEHLGYELDSALATVRSAGFDHLARFMKRSPEPAPVGVE